MKEKKWVDCPSCGSKGSMKYKKSITETYRNAGYEPISVEHLDGYYCAVCGDGIFTIKSNKRIMAELAEEKARQDSKRIVASDILDVDSIAKKLSVTRQRIHQMMDEGKISYVYVGKYRFPVRGNEKSLKLLKKRIHGHSNKL
jgi:YgiT-type zinc finger domain-containing protein